MSIIGIDAGATWLKAGRFSSAMRLEESIQVVSGAAKGVEQYFASIASAVQQLGGADRVGLALPGTMSKDGTTLQYAANVNGLMMRDRTPVVLGDALAKSLGTSHIVGENDAACAALAEWQQGVGGADARAILLLLTWGTGIGTALVVDGRAQYGWEGGHLPLTWDEKSDMPCSCGSPRDLEAFIAVPHLVKRAHVGPEALLKQAQDHQAGAWAVLDDALRWLARGLHMMSVLVYPDVVSIGGGFMASDWLLGELRRHVQQEAHGYLVTTLRPDTVHRARLGNNAGMIGAALLAKQRFG